MAKTGKCLEGRGAECPNLIAADPESIAAESVSDVEVEPPQADLESYHILRGIEPLSILEARRIARRGPTVFVMLVGKQDAGKTSLIARLHQMFQSGPIDELLFAGSWTLPRFEEINWLATVQSGVDEPMIERSVPKYDNSVLHFRVVCNRTKARVEILLNDVSGETFNAAVGIQAVCDQLLGVGRADHLVLALDGKAVEDSKLRNHELGQAIDFVERVKQSSTRSGKCELHFVLTKIDAAPTAAARIDAWEEMIRHRFSDAFQRISFWKLAARPKDGSMPTEEIVAKLFSSWVRTAPAESVVSTFRGEPQRDSREFCRFQA